MKGFTSLNQSEKLKGILPPESADTWYQHIGYSIVDGTEKPKYFLMVIRDWKSDDDIPCWSLMALLNVIPKRIKECNVLRIDIGEEDFSIWYDEIGCGVANTELPDITKASAVDACYEMIIKLHEQKLL